jgi:hypothetical protein
MVTLKLKEIQYSGFIERGIQDSIGLFSYEFTFGKSYLLNAELGKGAWAISWIIGGQLEHKNFGEITKNGLPYEQKQRFKDAWFVRKSEYQGLRASHGSVKSHIRHGLKSVQGQYLQSEAEIIKRFHLHLALYDRPIRQLSHEGWKVSCAIGLAHGKKLFCFPYIEYLRPYFIDEYYSLWFKGMIDLLRDSGAIVLVPAIARGKAQTLCDEIVQVENIFDYPEVE